jgi:hypothetical protein
MSIDDMTIEVIHSDMVVVDSNDDNDVAYYDNNHRH